MIIDLSNLTVIHDGRIPDSPPRQTYDHTRIVRVPSVDRKLRTKIHHDSSYDFQSYYTVEVWAGDAWQQIASLGANDLTPQDTPTSGYVPSDKWKAQAQAQVENLVHRLHVIALEVLS